MEKRKKLIYIVSFLLITGFAATSITSYYISRSSLRNEIINNELPLTSDNIYSKIQKDILRPVFISSIMATNTFLRDWVINGEKDKAQITRYLRDIKKKYHTFTSFFVSEKTRIYYQTNGVLKKVKRNDKRDKWYFRVRSMKTDYEINVDPDMANNDSMTIFINYKVFDYNHKFIGATGVGLNVSAVKNIIKKYQKDYGRNIFFIDKKGAIKLCGTNFFKNKKNIHNIQGLVFIADKILLTKNGHFQYKKNGQIIHLNTRYIPEFNWYLLVEQTEEQATKSILNTLLINLFACTIITLIVLFLTNITILSYQRRLEKMAKTDKLTGAFNRQAFDIVLNQILKDIQRKQYDLSIIMFDIDFFKNLNDKFGHPAGDAQLKNIVAVVTNIIRDSDILCRWGGEEFIILLKDCGINEAYKISEKIRKKVKETPVIYGDRKIFSTISLGVAQYHPFDLKEDLMVSVDQLLYLAKQNGRNRTEKPQERS